MKFFSKVKTTLLSIRESIKRFPITVTMSTILAILLIYMNETHLTRESREILEKINLIIGLSIPLSLCIGLLVEKFLWKNKSIEILLYGIGIGFLVLYYFNFINDYKMVPMSRYLGTMMFFLLSSLYIQRIGKNNKYEYYLMDIWSSFTLTFVYSFVLYFGVAAILFTIEKLFDVNIHGEIYYYMFLIVSLVFAVSLFLSKFPSMEEEYDEVEYTKALKILLIYIVIPLITIYTVILYVYFGKILITREWPRGLVSHLVLWYSTLAVGVIFLITPILENSKVAKLFKDLFPKIILPVIFMMFMSIYQRISQYGITENRYYIVTLGLWVLGIMLYFSFKKPLKNIIIPISLSLIILNSVYGPLSSFVISKFSQNKRFENILVRNNMLSNGQIVKNSEISLDDKREISNIISYFDSNHGLKDIKALPKDFDLDRMEDVLGFEYKPYYLYEKDRYFYYSVNNTEDAIDIKGYDHYVRMNSWNENKIEVSGLDLQYNRLGNSLIVSKEDNIIFEQDMLQFVNDIYQKQKNKLQNENKNYMSYKDMAYEIVFSGIEENINFKFIFTDVSGRIEDDNNLVIQSIDFILLIGNK
ncbi:protein of unknown function [Tissierella praeacuta DSM 18095]|uniref:DUF4153 domain-containing protein n=2 Tax=Tissierella praeacuta TaxID=43131 RepID=A0A1M4S578_9FIRM|nr:DUF4153 domain-containing protein [Tissierella praeacuta]SHE27167.1 protein of unknown function [Tissierella praeacuta DSM 18095]SUP00821.1 Uncharacterised protein [Tissierella praeacuta]